MTYLALLRGINVGGKNRLSMNDLTAMFVEAGCRDVRTYIQSGNVLFATTPSTAAKMPGQIAARIQERFGFRIPVILRTAAELEHAVANNPFLKAGAAEESLHLVFLAGVASAQSITRLDPMRSPPDEFAVRGKEVYLRLPHGVADSKLTNAYFDTKLATVSTARNWRTVLKLYALTKA